MHKQDSSITCRLDANGDFVWSHGYSSRPEHPIIISSDASPQPQSMSFNPPPSPNPIHPEGQNFFWRYFTGDELCVCGSPHGGHNACCEVAFCGICMHGEITQWTTGTNKAGEWCFWPYIGWLLVESDRRAIEKQVDQAARRYFEGRRSQAARSRRGRLTSRHSSRPICAPRSMRRCCCWI